MELLLRPMLWMENPAVFGEGRMIVVASFPGGEARVVNMHPQPAPSPAGLAGHFQVPLASCLWLSHSDACSSGSCTITRVLAGK